MRAVLPVAYYLFRYVITLFLFIYVITLSPMMLIYTPPTKTMSKRPFIFMIYRSLFIYICNYALAENAYRESML